MKKGDKVILDLESCFEIMDCKFDPEVESQLLGTLTIKNITRNSIEVIGVSGFSCFSKKDRLLPYAEFCL